MVWTQSSPFKNVNNVYLPNVNKFSLLVTISSNASKFSFYYIQGLMFRGLKVIICSLLTSDEVINVHIGSGWWFVYSFIFHFLWFSLVFCVSKNHQSMKIIASSRDIVFTAILFYFILSTYLFETRNIAPFFFVRGISSKKQSLLGACHSLVNIYRNIWTHIHLMTVCERSLSFFKSFFSIKLSTAVSWQSK